MTTTSCTMFASKSEIHTVFFVEYKMIDSHLFFENLHHSTTFIANEFCNSTIEKTWKSKQVWNKKKKFLELKKRKSDQHDLTDFRVCRWSVLEVFVVDGDIVVVVNVVAVALMFWM